MQRAERPGEVERDVVEREARRVALDEGDVVERGRALAREREQLGHAVDADDLAHERRERERERAGAGADVERALVAAREDEVRTCSASSAARASCRAASRSAVRANRSGVDDDTAGSRWDRC